MNIASHFYSEIFYTSILKKKPPQKADRQNSDTPFAIVTVTVADIVTATVADIVTATVTDIVTATVAEIAQRILSDLSIGKRQSLRIFSIQTCNKHCSR